jgi:hypothetical protein
MGMATARAIFWSNKPNPATGRVFIYFFGLLLRVNIRSEESQGPHRTHQLNSHSRGPLKPDSFQRHAFFFSVSSNGLFGLFLFGGRFLYSVRDQKRGAAPAEF